ncbi:hypothetical protein AVM02_06160 [Brucella anthropi]
MEHKLPWGMNPVRDAPNSVPYAGITRIRFNGLTRECVSQPFMSQDRTENRFALFLILLRRHPNEFCVDRHRPEWRAGQAMEKMWLCRKSLYRPLICIGFIKILGFNLRAGCVLRVLPMMR